MKGHALEDPETNPHALHARRLISQVSFNFSVSKHQFFFLCFAVEYWKIVLEVVLELRYIILLTCSCVVYKLAFTFFFPFGYVSINFHNWQH
jgi:hypothetical protein